MVSHHCYWCHFGERHPNFIILRMSYPPVSSTLHDLPLWLGSFYDGSYDLALTWQYDLACGHGYFLVICRGFSQGGDSTMLRLPPSYTRWWLCGTRLSPSKGPSHICQHNYLLALANTWATTPALAYKTISVMYNKSLYLPSSEQTL